MANKSATMQDLHKSSLLDAENASYLENLYESYIKDPNSIPPGWQKYFAEVIQGGSGVAEQSHAQIQDEFRKLARKPKTVIAQGIGTSAASTVGALARTDTACQDLIEHQKKQTRVLALIDAYRLLGTLHATLDPLKLKQKPLVPELMLSFYRLTDRDLPTLFEVGTLPGPSPRPLKQIIQDLQSIYCGTLASEFMQIPDSPERVWVETRVEALANFKLTDDEKRLILNRLTAAEGLEKYLGAKYPGAKRFSIEGCDSLIVLLDKLIHKAGSFGFKEIVMGMAHRGRLNVLVNILGKSPSQLFDEFEDKHDERLENGDVKYHQGFSSDVNTGDGNVHLSLMYNPSHLEIVSPVVCGSVRARIDRRNDLERKEILSIIMHGDAAFAGQGVVMETLNMSQTNGFCIGGTIHIITNNQIGFTTSDPKDARSTLYCSDIGKMMEVPIFHVNADDPEAVYRAGILAIEYRIKFKKDVIINLVGYRRHGHNEADEPSVTQPIMYKVIRNLPTVWQKYSEQLIKDGVISKDAVNNLNATYRELLDKRQARVALNFVENHTPTEYSSNWLIYNEKNWRVPTITSVNLDLLKTLGRKAVTMPDGFVLHPRIKKIMDDRLKMTEGTMPMDWGYGETMAYATLLNEGIPVRMSGQDVSRGTFFHRQATVHNQETGEEYTPLCFISDTQAKFSIFDSLLSELGVLGFEYGYASTVPKKLAIWEAQFGDFANEAQVVIDQFISSGEQKWGKLCGLVMFLPHGYEGQGPEHSSARLERYLQLCAEENIQVCVPSTPAQIFHLLRRQVLRNMRKPLIVLTPKSLLRHKLASSKLEEISDSKRSFLPMIKETEQQDLKSVRRVVFCTGKVYYDLLEYRMAQKIQDIAIIRIEQLYPFPDQELQEVLEYYKAVKDIVWCQEEPQNQGAWYSIKHHLDVVWNQGQGRTLRYAGRKAAAAPAVGYHHLHEEQQKALVLEALG